MLQMICLSVRYRVQVFLFLLSLFYMLCCFVCLFLCCFGIINDNYNNIKSCGVNTLKPEKIRKFKFCSIFRSILLKWLNISGWFSEWKPPLDRSTLVRSGLGPTKIWDGSFLGNFQAYSKVNSCFGCFVTLQYYCTCIVSETVEIIR